MRTTDLIPIILYQLEDGDKYGYEIVKQIEEKSHGKLSLKQPTLYTILKKLEHGRFISSYWADSDIGGKRHYYKLTENGISQLSTYPALEVLIKEALEEDLELPTNENKNIPKEAFNCLKPTEIETSLEETESKTSDYMLEETPIITPIDISVPSLSNNEDNTKYIVESIANTPYVDDAASITSFNKEDIPLPNPPINNSFSEENTSIIVETKMKENIDLFDALQPIDEMIDEEKELEPSPTTITVNENVLTKNTDKVGDITKDVEPNPTLEKEDIKLYNNLQPNLELSSSVENQEEKIYPIEQVKFINYSDFSNDKSVLRRKDIIKKHIQKMALTCCSLLAIIILSLFICSKYEFSKLFYATTVTSALVAILYPFLLISNISKLRLKYCSKPFKYYKLKDFLVKLLACLTLVIAITAYNITIVDTISAIFNVTNSANFIFPICYAFVFILDWMYSVVLYKKYYSREKRK